MDAKGEDVPLNHGKARKIAVIGECMIERRPNITEAGYTCSTMDAQTAYGGETLNVATHLARLGPAVRVPGVLAALVVRHRGAIIPQWAMRQVED